MTLRTRGNTLSFEPDAAQTALLGYRRHDVRRAIAEVAAIVEKSRAA